MTKSQRKQLEDKKGIGKEVSHKRRDGSGDRYRIGTVEDEVSLIVDADRGYKHLIQRIKLLPEEVRNYGCKYVYRTCYYAIATDSGKLVFGQFNAVLGEPQYRQLLSKARAKGWLGTSKA